MVARAPEKTTARYLLRKPIVALSALDPLRTSAAGPLSAPCRRCWLAAYVSDERRHNNSGHRDVLARRES